MLDDDTDRAEVFREWYPQAIVVHDASECISRLSECWDIIYLDFNLSGLWLAELGTNDDGLAAVAHIVDHKPEHLRSTSFVVHTDDVRRGGIMAAVLQSAGYSAEHIPYWQLLRKRR